MNRTIAFNHQFNGFTEIYLCDVGESRWNLDVLLGMTAFDSEIQYETKQF